MSAADQSWLNTWIWTVIVFGALVAAGALPATDAPIHWLFDYLNAATPLPPFDDTTRFSLAVLGAVTISWGLALKAGVLAAIQLPPEAAQPVWRLMTASVIVWFVVDTVLGFATGFWVTVFPNLSVLATWLWPVWRSGVLSKTSR